VITIDDRSAYKAVFELSHGEAIFTGSSGGAAAVAARQIAEPLTEDALVVTLFPDSGERYLSKLNDDWLQRHDLLP
jgi:cysteine synthase